jgi:hypothetical protein
MINPVAGFLLPDHVDESLEVFDTAGTPLGELLTTGQGGPDGGGVAWSLRLAGRYRSTHRRRRASHRAGAAGRPGRRHGRGRRSGKVRRRLAPGDESALSALLRAIDTTLWTVDTVAGAGSAEVAAIVGRPRRRRPRRAGARRRRRPRLAHPRRRRPGGPGRRIRRAGPGRGRGSARRDHLARRRPAGLVPAG